MTRYLLDTTFLIDYLGGSDDVRRFLEAHEDEEFATTAMNYKEVAVGLRLDDGLDPARLAAAFEWLDVVPIAADHALAASTFEAELYRSDDHTRRAVDAATADLLIAGVAEGEGMTVVTPNVDDFEPFVPVAEY
ncbi:PilT protein domain-containing protein [Halorubrum californiense DSM 19288]|uniref:Ribonuclease VapC n=1 Tax=Halorubrum californiense DSM 19288 TaxID=1227465 RepID=M0E2R1_9EURY|nr:MULTISPECIES: PIN domain-containing protein [Halorubrum]ELZ41333.1 PilT protein domain-containing protein [Halorubrum californiense DSM 19288]TKX67510.1 type II toxin-antitoxin system VapC family toxin [Halorubrum sp. GN11GM_10-3_MGM]